MKNIKSKKMGFILSKIIEFFTRSRNNFKIIILGMQNAGKTTILYRLSLGQLVKTTPTIGSNVEELNYNNVKFQAWDLGGQESTRSVWDVRLYLGVHFPGDILVGILWGGIVGSFVYWNFNRLSPRQDFISSQYTSSGYQFVDVDVVVSVLVFTLIYAFLRACLMLSA